MKKFILLIISSYILVGYASVDLTPTQLGFLPTPKYYSETGKAKLPRNGYTFVCNFANVDAGEMLADGMAYCGWKELKQGGFTIEIIKDQTLKRPEEFTLSIDDCKIVIKAGTSSGAWRGLGRMLSVVCGPRTMVNNDSVSLIKCKIHDWPDIKVRAMKIEVHSDSKVLIPHCKKYIRSVALFGFNTLFLDCHSRMESRHHPEIVREPIINQATVRELIRYARNCGLEVYPVINSVGHMNSAPQIFPLYKENDVERKKPIAMNIAHPKFYEVLFSYLDEICELFNHPKYLLLGCDEFHPALDVLKKATGKPMDEYFSEYLQKVNKYMLSKNNCQVIIWHDMLFELQTPYFINFPSNGPKGAEKVLDRLPKNFSIAMWKYEYSPNYPLLTKLTNCGFSDLWGATWYSPKACQALSKRCYELGAKLLGTTWWINPHAQGVPTAGEFAWNAANSKLHEADQYDMLIDHHYYGRNSAIPVVSKIRFPSGGQKPPLQWLQKYTTATSPLFKFDFSKATSFARPEFARKPLKWPWNLKELEERKIIDRLSFSWGNSIVLRKFSNYRIDKARTEKTSVFYTPMFGKSTRTNWYGPEMAIVDGKIIHYVPSSENSGNMEIPSNGIVLSLHKDNFGNGYNYNRSSRTSEPKTGDTLNAYISPDPLKYKSQNIMLNFDGKHERAVVFLTMRHPVCLTQTLASFRMDSDQQKGNVEILRGKRFFSADRNWSGKWKFYLLPGVSRSLNPILCMEWYGKKGEHPKKMIISSQVGGEAAGLTILGAVEF